MAVICPTCRSTDIHAEKRGWSLLTGFIGSGKIVLTCLSCGKGFKPGQGWAEQQSAASASDQAIGWAVLLGIVLLVTLFFHYC
jgi:hypothetical protein